MRAAYDRGERSAGRGGRGGGTACGLAVDGRGGPPEIKMSGKVKGQVPRPGGREKPKSWEAHAPRRKVRRREKKVPKNGAARAGKGSKGVVVGELHRCLFPTGKGSDAGGKNRVTQLKRVPWKEKKVDSRRAQKEDGLPF